MPRIEQLSADKWTVLRHIRLKALQDSPDMFLATYEKEKDFPKAKWLAEFGRGQWYVGRIEGRLVCMLGVTEFVDDRTPPDARYIEFMWVAPQWRRSGFARYMLDTVVARRPEVGTWLLWVLNGNDAAAKLYKRSGFSATDVWQPLDAKPGRTEHLMRKDLRAATRAASGSRSALRVDPRSHNASPRVGVSRS